MIEPQTQNSPFSDGVCFSHRLVIFGYFFLPTEQYCSQLPIAFSHLLGFDFSGLVS